MISLCCPLSQIEEVLAGGKSGDSGAVGWREVWVTLVVTLQRKCPAFLGDHFWGEGCGRHLKFHESWGRTFSSPTRGGRERGEEKQHALLVCVLMPPGAQWH